MSASRRPRNASHLNYNHLHYFHVTAVEGSVGGAAHYLGVTQPTISEQLATLERSLGVVLFNRQSSGLKLTEAGRLTFKHTSVMFNASARLAEELEHGSRQAIQALRVGVCSPVARMSALSVLAPLLDIEHCVPSIHIADHVELVRELRAGTLDLAITDIEPPKPERRGIDVLPLQQTRLSVVSRQSLLPSPDWHELHLLQYRVGSQLRSDVDAFLAARGLRPRVAAEADDAWLLLDAVARGNHIAVVPYSLVRDALTVGRLHELERFESTQVGVFALFRAGVELARCAVDRLAAHFANASKTE